MARITVDFRFVEIEHELWALAQCLPWVENQIEYLRNQDKVRTRASLEEQGLAWEEPEVQIAFQEIQDRAESVFPRFLRGPFVTSLWGCYESGVRELADAIARGKQLDLRLRDVRGENFVDGARRYFKAVLGLPLDTDDTRLSRIRDLLVVRNAFAHGNGQERALPDNMIRHIEALTRRGVEVRLVNGYLVPSPAYLVHAFDDVDRSLRDLVLLVRGGPVVRRIGPGGVP